MLRLMSELEQKIRVLFVCTQNKVRSLTAEHLYRVRPDLEVKSAGTANFAKNQLTREVMEWADIVFIFDESQQEIIHQRFGPDALGKPVVLLGLPDVFTYKSDALVVKLVAKLDPYLGRPTAKKCPRGSLQKLQKLTASKTSQAVTPAKGSLVAKILTAFGVREKKSQATK
jgi:predicted protein tyrosine phosphatase